MSRLIKNILIVEDDSVTREILKAQLTRHGYECRTASNSVDALKQVGEKNEIDLCILDYRLGLDSEDGLSLCRKLKNITSAPIVMLTGESSLDVIVKSLYAGANQYITKPYNLDELLARVYAALQTTTDSIQPRTGGNPGSFAVITEHRTLKCDGKSITLTKREWDLWQLLVLQPEIVVSRDHIHRALFNQGYLPFSRAVDIIAGRLRKKLRSLTDEVAILSVRSSGYVLARNRKV